MDRRSIKVRIMDFQGTGDDSLRFVIPLLVSTRKPETFRDLLARIKQLLIGDEGLAIQASDLEHYTRFVGAEGDIYLLNTSVQECLGDASELQMITEDSWRKKRKRTHQPPPPSDKPPESKEMVEHTSIGWPAPPSLLYCPITPLGSDAAPSSLPSYRGLTSPTDSVASQITPPSSDAFSTSRVDSPSLPSSRGFTITTNTAVSPSEFIADLLPGLKHSSYTTSIASLAEAPTKDPTQGQQHTPPTQPLTQENEPRQVSSEWSHLPKFLASFPTAATTTTTTPTANFVEPETKEPMLYMNFNRASCLAQQNPQLPSLDLAKNDLQSYFQTQLGPRSTKEIEYALDKADGLEFFVSIALKRIDQSGDIVGRGRASRKKDAEKLAALDALVKLGWPRGKLSPPEISAPTVNPKVVLNEMFHKLWKSSPNYTFKTDPMTGLCTAELKVGNVVLEGTGVSKAKASAEVAEKALVFIQKTSPTSDRHD